MQHAAAYSRSGSPVDSAVDLWVSAGRRLVEDPRRNFDFGVGVGRVGAERIAIFFCIF